MSIGLPGLSDRVRLHNWYYTGSKSTQKRYSPFLTYFSSLYCGGITFSSVASNTYVYVLSNSLLRVSFWVTYLLDQCYRLSIHDKDRFPIVSEVSFFSPFLGSNLSCATCYGNPRWIESLIPESVLFPDVWDIIYGTHEARDTGMFNGHMVAMSSRIYNYISAESAWFYSYISGC